MPTKQITITTEYIKLDSFLKFVGESMTGGTAKERIAAGEILVNGEICTMRGKKLRVGDTVTVGETTFQVVAQ